MRRQSIHGLRGADEALAQRFFAKLSMMFYAGAVVLAQEPSFDKGEITEKGSLNQLALRANNGAVIAAMYAGEGGVLVV
jgi:hypothetical protein